MGSPPIPSPPPNRWRRCLIRSNKSRIRTWPSCRRLSTSFTTSSWIEFHKAVTSRVEQVNEIAQGRVWSGSEAIRIKLVDEIGGLSSAIAYAANLTHLGGQPRITEFPGRKDLSEKLKELFQIDSQTALSPGLIR